MNNELVKKGDWVVKGNLAGRLQHGSNMLGFIVVDKHSYVVAIKDRLVNGWEKVDE